jgi:hypothetical protein
MTQDAPFQVSPSDSRASLLVRESPTALQKVFDRQDTPSRALPATCLGVGGRRIVHFLPFHISDRTGWAGPTL